MWVWLLKALRAVVDQLKSERDSLKEENQKAINDLADMKEQLETQELVWKY